MSSPGPTHSEVRLAVIVPFRDQPLQNRREQLQRFLTHMTQYLRSSAIKPTLQTFHMFIVEQTHDTYKFNRGKLLNAGFVLAQKSPHAPFTSICFHDVDLLPGPSLGPWYALSPQKNPVHIGAVWSRYPYPSYVGGILTLSPEQILKTNGFPNNFWGWGGEDDEMSKRLQEAKLTLMKPGKLPANAIVDLEEVLIKEKGGERAGTGVKAGGRSEWRNMQKREKLAKHAETWKTNGIRTVDFTVKTIRESPFVTIFTVDLHPEHDKDSQTALLFSE